MNALPSRFYLIGNALSSAEQNHRVISQNIANVNTPGYKARQLSFDEYTTAVRNGDAEKGLLSDLHVEMAAGLMSRMDGNNVDIDRELVDLKENALMFQTYSQLLAAKMSTMRKAISG